MYRKFAAALRNLHRRQKCMTGLETAIILIAFVTVGSVLAYSVLSAGIFSAERGKEAVYKGLSTAQNTVKVQGNVLGFSSHNTIQEIQFTLGLAMSDQRVDTGSIIVNYYDVNTHSENVTATFTKSVQSAERGAVTAMEGDELFIALITIPASVTLGLYHKFTLQLMPPSGATLTITRTTPGALTAVTELY